MRNKTAGLVLCAAALGAVTARADGDLGARAGSMLAAMEGDAHRVALLLRTARAARTPGPIKCVDANLSRIDTDVRHGRDDIADLRAALSTGDVARANRAMSWLASRREAARSASFAADACVTPSAPTERDRTTVHVVPPKLPPDRAVFGR
ncbi:MAG TPA: hypothetical protein VGH28_16430 [Polyangiaceae bacterium]|jgi:hypothetical protein